MTPDTNAVNGPAEPQGIAPARMAETRPLYWSIRREVWENRSVYIAPLIVASVALFGFLISTITLPSRMRALAALEPARQRGSVILPFSMAASVLLMTGFIVAAFYCFDALYGERRDRSILFWKSMPVSDRTTVLAKALIPLLVAPLIAFTVALVTQVIMLVLSTMVLVGNGINPAMLWSRLPLPRMTMVMLYGLTAHVLWFAPIYGWLLLVSAWARRTPFLWAVLPFPVLTMVERMAFGTTHIASMLRYRVVGAMAEGFDVDPKTHLITRFSQLDPVGLLTSAGFWSGLLFAVACLIAAVRLRRNREPI